jgi:hypothetical protein
MKTSLLVLSALLGVSTARKLRDHKFLQLEDHANDTDDIVEDARFIQLRDHENDTDDIPDGLDPSTAVLTRDEDGGWVTYMQHAGDIAKKNQEHAN